MAERLHLSFFRTEEDSGGIPIALHISDDVRNGVPGSPPRRPWQRHVVRDVPRNDILICQRTSHHCIRVHTDVIR